MNNAQLINATSGNTEWYTPSKIIEAARALMGGIDLDPASSEKANEIVQAKSFITQDNDGLTLTWYGNVWLNHPFGRNTNSLWIKKLIKEYNTGHITQACCITFSSTSEAWFQPLMDFPQCYLAPRTNYLLPDGTVKRGVTKGSVVTFLRHDVTAAKRFRHHFGKLGKVMMPVSN